MVTCTLESVTTSALRSTDKAEIANIVVPRATSHIELLLQPMAPGDYTDVRIDSQSVFCSAASSIF